MLFPISRRARAILQRASGVAAGAAIVLAAAACSPAGSIESADVPAWKATALPSADGTVLEDAGKILNREPIVKTAPGFGAGTYILTITCDGGGKAFFDVTLDGARLPRPERPATAAGRLHASRSPLTAAPHQYIECRSPLIYAYQLAPAA